MKNFFKIILIFLYFTLCFVFKGDIEAHFANDCQISQKSSNNVIEQINFQDNFALTQNNNQEITNLQNNSRNYNPIFQFKKYFIISANHLFKNSNTALFNSNYLTFNYKYTIYTRAP